MGKQVKISLLILLFMNIFNFSMAHAFMVHQKTKQNVKITHACNIKVINIVIDKIYQKYIYAKDGRKFPISSTTKIIDNTANTNSKIKIAKLIFKNNQLITIILK